MAFVVFEGIDGSGKTSLIQRLTEHVRGLGHDLVVTREPGGTVLGDAIRELLLNPHGDAPTPRAELLLYEAGRAHHVESLIRPALTAGKWVLCDRYVASSVAFQAHARGLSEPDVHQLNHFATGGLTADLTVLLDLDPREGEKRREHRTAKTGTEADRFEREALSFHQRVRESYLRQANAAREPWLVLDASLSREDLFAQLLHHLRQLQWPGF